MHRFLQYSLNDNNTESVALPQKIKKNTSLLLNGIYGGRSKAAIAQKGFSQYVSLTSDQNLSGVNFTIQGYQNSVPVNFPMKGPDSTTVFDKDHLLDTIVSITSDKDATDTDLISVGTVANEVNLPIYSLPIMIDFPFRQSINCLLSIDGALKDSGSFNATYSVYGALQNIVNNGKLIQDMLHKELINLGSLTLDKRIFPIKDAYRYCVVEVIPKGGFPATVIRFSQNN